MTNTWKKKKKLIFWVHSYVIDVYANSPLESVSLCLCLYLSLSVYLSLCLSVSLSLCLSVSLSLCLCLSVCLSVSPSLSVSLCLSLSLFLSVSLSLCLCLSVSLSLSLTPPFFWKIRYFLHVMAVYYHSLSSVLFFDLMITIHLLKAISFLSSSNLNLFIFKKDNYCFPSTIDGVNLLVFCCIFYFCWHVFLIIKVFLFYFIPCLTPAICHLKV